MECDQSHNFQNNLDRGIKKSKTQDLDTKMRKTKFSIYQYTGRRYVIN